MESSISTPTETPVFTKNSEVVESLENQQALDKWSIPAVAIKSVYKQGTFDFLHKTVIKTQEDSISVNNDEASYSLMTIKDLQSFRAKFKYLHIGLIQVALKPLTLLGTKTSLIAMLRDARDQTPSSSIMGAVQTSLSSGPVYFNVYPNLKLSLTDPNLLDAVTFNIRTTGYNFKPGSETIAIIYRIYYKVMNTLKPNVQNLDFKGHTTLIESNCLSTRVVTRKVLDWTKLPLPETWTMNKVIDPKPIIDTTIDQITESDDGSLEISFVPNQRTRLTLPRSNSVKNFSDTFSDLAARSSLSEKPYHVSYPPSYQASSSSRIPYTRETFVKTEPPSRDPSLIGVKISENQIPHGVYQTPYHTVLTPSEVDESDSNPLRSRRRTSPTVSEAEF